MAEMELKGRMMQIAELNFLVAEDDPAQSWAVATMLKKLGAKHITEVANGVEALAVFQDKQRQPIDIALIDLDMPHMDGMELIRHLANSINHSAIILVIFLDFIIFVYRIEYIIMHSKLYLFKK